MAYRSSTFTAQTEAGEVDPKMLRYIEEQMRQARIASEEDSWSSLSVACGSFRGLVECEVAGQSHAPKMTLSKPFDGISSGMPESFDGE